MKLPTMTAAAARLSNEKEKEKKKQSKKEDLYGLDVDMLEMLGLDDYLNDSDDDEKKKNEEKKKEQDPSWNMTYEDMRKQFDIDGQHLHVNKLRGACKNFKDVVDK